MELNRYEVKVSLKNLEKKINRMFLINDNVKITDFCKAIITSMNGDLSHLYVLKYKNKYYLCDNMTKDDYNEIKMGSLRISKLLFEEKEKLELIYDFGDNWIFKTTINKILKGHNDKNFILLKGIGKGIEEDCGGIWGLEDLIENKNNNWGYDIDDFSIEKINDILDKYYNKRN